MNKIKKTIRGFAAACLAVSVILFGNIIWISNQISEQYYVAQGNDLLFSELSAVTAKNKYSYEKTSLVNMNAGTSKTVSLNLFGVIPIKTAHVTVINRTNVYSGGNIFGIKLFTKGVIVIDTSSVSTKAGTVYPAKLANIQKGDIIISINDVEITSNEHLAQLISQSNGKPLKINYMRENKNMVSTLTPVQSSQDGTYKCGVWVRDSSAGIGTVTYYTQDGHFGGLGHGICDSDTGEIMPLYSGLACPVTLSGLKKSKAGSPGELQGYFSGGDAFGTLSINNEAGIFGKMARYEKALSMPVKLKQEVKCGKATILCTLDSGGTKEYEINIDKVELNASVMTKNIIISVTDKELLDKAGGIVQGMSGSPIIQDGMLVGAVTHVFVNDSTKGYGIFAENMLSYSDKLS